MDLVLTNCCDPLITVLTLNRPEKRNALNLALMESLTVAIESAARLPTCRAIILRSEGPAFCAGLDLHEAEAGDPAPSAKALKRLYEAICLSPLVTVAAAQGAAMGGGAGLVAACDLAIVSEDFQLAFPEVRRGLVAALVTCLIRRQIGDRTTRELILLGRTVAAEEAFSLTLVNRVTKSAALLETAMQVGGEVCAGAPGAVARTKQLLDRLSPRPIAAELEAALEFHLQARHSPEAAEGIAAFKEKRDPKWPTRA